MGAAARGAKGEPDALSVPQRAAVEADPVLGQWADWVGAWRGLADPDNPAEMIPPTVAGLAWPGHVSLFAAREKSGKSTTMSAAAVAVLRGQPYGGLQVDAGRVVWVTEESRHTLEARAEAQGAGAADMENLIGVDVRRLRNGAASAGANDQAAALAAMIRDMLPALVVIDTLDPFRIGIVGEASRPDDWARVFEPLIEAARETGAAVVIAHHAAKAGGARDSTAIGAAVDVLIEPDTSKKSAPGCRVFTVRARAGLDASDWELSGYDRETETATVTLLDTKAAERAQEARRRKRERVEQAVRDFVGANPRASTRAIRDGVTGGSAALDAALGRLVRDGAIACEDGKRGAHLYSLADAPQGPP